MEATSAAQQPVVQPPRARGAVKAAKAAANPAPQQQRNLAADQAKRVQQQRNLTANAVVSRYVGGFQKQVGLSDEQTKNLSDSLGKYVRRQLMLAQSRTDALRKLKDLTDQNAPEEEILEQNKVVEASRQQLANTERKFYSDINPQLTVQQQGKLKVYLEETAQDIRQAIQKTQP
jgi:hypothetical protein